MPCAKSTITLQCNLHLENLLAYLRVQTEVFWMTQTKQSSQLYVLRDRYGKAGAMTDSFQRTRKLLPHTVPPLPFHALISQHFLTSEDKTQTSVASIESKLHCYV